jgi:hypothetical protein
MSMPSLHREQGIASVPLYQSNVGLTARSRALTPRNLALWIPYYFGNGSPALCSSLRNETQLA